MLLLKVCFGIAVIFSIICKILILIFLFSLADEWKRPTIYASKERRSVPGSRRNKTSHAEDCY